MEQYLRPETLFGSKFEGYLNQKINTNEKYSISSLPEWYANQDIVQPNVEVDDEELKRLQEKLGG
jgi:conserved phage C-terminus (phg_2220_C)